MSAGLLALDAEDWSAARDAFVQALELRPDSAEAAEGLARADLGARLAEIADRRGRVEALEAGEDWAAAVEQYEALLELAEDLVFARDGLARARELADVHARLAFHIAHPERLAAAKVLAEAEALLERADAMQSPGPELRRRKLELARHLAVYATPVRVTLRSDGETLVTIRRVEELGAFRRHALDLRPGTYVVVGRRDGYRDARLELVVEPGAETVALDIRCEEKL